MHEPLHSHNVDTAQGTSRVGGLFGERVARGVSRTPGVWEPPRLRVPTSDQLIRSRDLPIS